MKALLVFATALAAVPLAAAEPVTSLPGVSDEETTISYGQIEDFERGHGDVLFVRDRANRWFRLALNDGCLKSAPALQSIEFDNSPGSRIDTFTRIKISEGMRNCSIKSIRRSDAPPQVDSNSKVTLD